MARSEIGEGVSGLLNGCKDAFGSTGIIGGDMANSG